MSVSFSCLTTRSSTRLFLIATSAKAISAVSVVAEKLMTLCEPGIIDKIRWLVKSGEHTFEVDEFFGDNAGLIIAEVELSSADEQPVIPHFIGKEVSGDRRYYNSQLRLNPYRLWKDTE